MDLKVGELTNSFWKDSDRPSSVSQAPSEGYETATDAHTLIAELARRLNVVEGRIEIKVDKDGIPSAIMLAQDAMLITSDRIGVLGDVSFLDYVRDQNGTATGEIDYSVTRIRGGVIQTETIISGNLSEIEGSSLNLDDGDFIVGGTRDPRLQYTNATGELDIRGIVKISDTFESNGTTINEYGMFLTGTAFYNGATGLAEGTGIIIGSPGIYGVENGLVKLAFEAATGNAIFGGDVETTGYMHATGLTDSFYTVNLPGFTMETFSSVWGEMNASPLGINKLYAGVSGTAYGEVSASSMNAGVVGLTDSDGAEANPENRNGVLGIAFDGGNAIYGYSSLGTGVIGYGAAPSAYGVHCYGLLGVSEHIMKANKDTGVLKIFNVATGNQEGQYKYTFTAG